MIWILLFFFQSSFLYPITVQSSEKNHQLNYLFYGKFDTLCDHFSFAKFPFDVQTCVLIFYTDDPVTRLNFSSIETLVDDTTLISEIDIWKVEGSGIEVVPTDYTLYQLWQIRVSLTLGRKYQYYVGNVFAPSVGLYIIQLVALVLPPDMPDRPTFSITVVLAYTFVLTSVFSIIPRTTETVYLVILLEFKLFLSIFITCYMLIVCAYVAKKKNCKVRCIDCIVAVSTFLFVVVADTTLIMLMISS